MDVAVPITNGDSDYVVCVRDNKTKAGELNRRIFLIIMEALLVGLVISVVLSFLLSKTLVVPIQSLTRAAELMAGGDFSDRIETRESDEIGVLTNTFNDMADRLHSTLEDIENERNKLSTVFLHMTDGVMAFSRSGALIQYNPAASRLLEMSFDDGPTFETLFGDIVSLDLALALGTSDVLEAEREINDRHLEMFLAPFSGEGEQGGGILVVIHDVTEQVRSDQQRREFVANVSHELRTPITSVRSYAETLTESGDEMEAEMRKRFLDVIMNESDRMTKIVQDLLVLSRFDSEKTEMTFEKFDMAESLRHVYDALIIDAEKKGLTMSLDLESEPIMLEGDRARIEQVVINVVSNSVRYTPEGGSIAISARGGDEVSVSVTDTGIGIPEADVPHLFDRFYRVDKGRSRAQGGTGLGLSIAKEIVDRHNGRIDVESTLGEGTTVTVTLPAVRKGAAS
jgi:two-component system sensor histidine kinase VicK